MALQCEMEMSQLSSLKYDMLTKKGKWPVKDSFEKKVRDVTAKTGEWLCNFRC